MNEVEFKAKKFMSEMASRITMTVIELHDKYVRDGDIPGDFFEKALQTSCFEIAKRGVTKTNRQNLYEIIEALDKNDDESLKGIIDRISGLKSE